MELMFSYFWIVKLILFIATIWLGYKSLKKSLKTKKILNLYTLGFVVALLFHVVAPIKMDVNVKAITDYANNQTEQNKILPDKVQDNNFKTKSDAIDGITKEDLK